MKMKKILASVAAAALAVSAMATNAFADAAYSGSYSFSDSAWWTQDWIMGGDSGKPVSDLIGDVDPSAVTSITFTSDTSFVIGYNNTDGGWSQPSDQTSYTLTDVLLESFVDDAGDTHDPALCLCLSKGDGVEYTINWTVEADAAAPSGDSAAEAGPAFDKTYKAVLAYADTVWAAQDWDSSVDVPAYGTYTIKSSVDGFADFGVFCIDIAELGADLGVQAGSGEYDMTKCTISDLKVIVDGSEIAVDMSKVLWGDPEEKGNLRIEIYNQYGSTKDASPIDNTISGTTLEVQFTLAPVAAEAPETTTEAPAETTEAPAETTTEAPAETTAAPAETTAAPAETTAAPAETTAAPAQAGDTNAATADKNNADTGIEGVAVVAGLAILAAGAVVIAKKRK